jgi:hypothetical protein
MGYSHVRENFVKVWGGGLEPARPLKPTTNYFHDKVATSIVLVGMGYL